MMKKRYYVVGLVMLLSVGFLVGLHVTGYLFNDQRIIPPVSSVEWEMIQDESPGDNSSGSEFPSMLNLTETLQEVPGIERIKYKVFVSSESMDQVLAYYTEVLEHEGYAYHEEYSGMKTFRSSEIYYYSFAKGLNGVVVFLSEYHQWTWVCYSTGNVLQYQRIFDYVNTHDILQ
jgi:hypothetical protein